jgi:O-Antigen ligase
MAQPRESPVRWAHCYSRRVSTLASARSRATPEPAGAASRSRGRRAGLTADAVFGAALAAGFAVIVFVATGGTDLGQNTWVEITLTAIAAACAVAVVMLGARGRPWGALALLLFAALAALTYASIAWSVQPADSWVEANRTLAYLAAFGAAVALARLVPARWPAVVGAVGTVAVVVCGYALLAKVFPATLNAGDTLGRLRVPFSYWNATGLMAALGLPACLWAGARPDAGRALRALSVPAIAVLATVLMLSYSRGALIAAVIGVGCWFVLVPLRLRAALLLALGAVGAVIASGWALAHHAITHDGATLAARTSAGHTFGLVLLLMVAVMALAGAAAAYGADRVTLAEPVRRRIGIALLVLVSMVPVAGIAGVAASSRGLTGEISHVWNVLTSPTSHVGNSPGRIAQLGNSRPLYWSQGLKVGEHALLAGTGAAGFDTARTRYSTSKSDVAHAHSYLIETFADFGLIGIAVSLGLLAAWGLAVARTLGFRGGSRTGGPDAAAAASASALATAADSPYAVATAADSPDTLATTADSPAARTTAQTNPSAHAAERIGLFTMLAVVVIFGVSSLIDWTWFIPGVTVPALVCAGWLAGRGPISEPVGRAKQRRRLSASPGTAAAAMGIAAATLVAGWFVWQPLHSANQFGAAITAMSRGDSAAALADAHGAAASDPVSVDPLYELSAIYSARRDLTSARQELVTATSLQPSNPETWQALAMFDLDHHQPSLALLEFQTAQELDLSSASIGQQIGEAQRAASQQP